MIAFCDDDVDIESVSIFMGHHSTKTTEGYYCRKNEKKAIKSITEAWEGGL